MDATVADDSDDVVFTLGLPTTPPRPTTPPVCPGAPLRKAAPSNTFASRRLRALNAAWAAEMEDVTTRRRSPFRFEKPKNMPPFIRKKQKTRSLTELKKRKRDNTAPASRPPSPVVDEIEDDVDALLAISDADQDDIDTSSSSSSDSEELPPKKKKTKVLVPATPTTPSVELQEEEEGEVLSQMSHLVEDLHLQIIRCSTMLTQYVSLRHQHEHAACHHHCYCTK
jgi:hypothetical protein